MVLYVALLVYFCHRKANLIRHPEQSKVIIQNPDILEMADALFADVIYQDKYIVMSHYLVAPTSTLTPIVPTAEVFVLYRQMHNTRYYGVETVKDGDSLILLTSKGQITISIFKEEEETIKKMVYAIASNCPNIKVGHTPENIKYVQEMYQNCNTEKLR